MRAKDVLKRIGLIVVGLAFIGYFGLLVSFTDCSSDCVRAGEQMPAFAFIGLGVFLTMLGILLSPQRSTLRAIGASLFVAAIVALAGVAWVYARGGRGTSVWIMLAIASADALVGGWLAFWRPR